MSGKKKKDPTAEKPATDSGATTTQATADSLGNPSYIVPVFTNGSTVYRYRVGDAISYNASVSYRIRTASKWLNDTTVRDDGVKDKVYGEGDRDWFLVNTDGPSNTRDETDRTGNEIWIDLDP